MNEKSNFYNSLHQYKLSRVATLNIILRTYTIVRASLVIKIANKFFYLAHSFSARVLDVCANFRNIFLFFNQLLAMLSKQIIWNWHSFIFLFKFFNFLPSFLFLFYSKFQWDMAWGFFFLKSFNFMFIFNF